VVFVVTSREGSPVSTFTVKWTKSSSYVRISRLANKRKAAMMCVCLTMALSSRSSAYISSLHVQVPNGQYETRSCERVVVFGEK
jgi:hypothetical protein